jgi:hypothetical protein
MARADMTPGVFGAVRLNRRAPDSWQLPRVRLLAPDCTMRGSRMDRVAHPNSEFQVGFFTLPLHIKLYYHFRCWGGVIWEIPDSSAHLGNVGLNCSSGKCQFRLGNVSLDWEMSV